MTQVSCMWDEILWLRQCVTVSQSSCSCILQTRFKMLLAISQMQVRGGLQGASTSGGAQWAGPLVGKPTSPARALVSGRTGCHCLVLPARRWGGSGVSGFMAISWQGAVGCQWVLYWAGWFPAGSCPDPQRTAPRGSPLTCCLLLPSRPVVQGLLGIQDLGQVFFEPVKDKQGNILIVTLKEVKTNQTFESVRWVPICKLQTSRKSVSSPEEPTALDMLLISIQVLCQCCCSGEMRWVPLQHHQHSLLLLRPRQSLGHQGFGPGCRQRGSRTQPACKNPAASRGGTRLVPDSSQQDRVVLALP